MTDNGTLTFWLGLDLSDRRVLCAEAFDAAAASIPSHGAFVSTAGAQAAHERCEGVLAGVPFSVKDNIDVAGLVTTGGTAFLQGSVAAADAGAVSAVRCEGGVVVGKTNLHELALGITSNNAAYGPVRNPFDRDRMAGGSSGGSAVSVGLGVVPFGFCTDTGGSVTIPASMCGVVGFRPTTGRYPSDGVITISTSRDSVGIHANCVSDVQLVDSIVSPTRPDPPMPRAHDLTVGVPASRWSRLDKSVEEVCQAALQALERAGATLVAVDTTEAEDLANEAGLGLVFFEAVRGLNAYATQLQEPYSARRFTDMVPLLASPDVRAIGEAILAQPISSAEYARLQGLRTRLRRAYADAFARTGVDAFAFPSVPMSTPAVGVDDSVMIAGEELPLFPTAIRNANAGTVAGVPMLSVPAGRTADGMPVGLTLEGHFHCDRALLLAGRCVEDIV